MDMDMDMDMDMVMDMVGAQEASSTMSPCPYHVFLSFRGEDTRKSFTDHLYRALVSSGFRTFRDNEGIERGENIKSELESAIMQSRCSIIVFSEDYTSSAWCLDELVMILRHKRNSEHFVVPVFYHVDPSHVRKQTGRVAKSFAVHEERCKAETGEGGKKRQLMMDKVQSWREALKEIADLAGMPLQNQADGYEGRFINKIIKVVGRKLNRMILSVDPNLIERDLQFFNRWLHSDTTDIGITAICGMGGLGKTTIAKCIFNQNYESFEGSSFLFNIREVSEESDGLIRLQRDLLSDILKGEMERISSVDRGIIRIMDAICRKKVLIVLDDVDNLAQLDAIVGTRDWLYHGSKIIITTRHAGLLKDRECYKIDLEKLDENESLKLFCRHAFRKDCPADGYTELSKRAVAHCGGLPLALQVLGSSLGGSVDVWKNTMQKLEAIPNSEIVKRLKISYDSLQDDHDKNLFLEIAGFFVGEERNDIIAILEGDFYPMVGIRNLEDRSLIAFDQDDRLVMHQLLQDMAGEIIRMESPKEPGKRSRLCNPKDSFAVLKENTGTETIEGLALTGHTLEENRSTLIGISDAKQEVDLKTNAFTRMRKLRLLKMSYVQVRGGYKHFPRKLKWLCWHGFPSDSIPMDFPLERLVALEVCNSNLKQVWNKPKFLGYLKILNVSHCHALTRTPDFSVLPNLEKLILKDCASLVEVDESIAKLDTKLVVLNLESCKNLRKLPRGVGLLKVLETLVLTGCSDIRLLPTDLIGLRSLKILIVPALPRFIDWKSLQSLEIIKCDFHYDSLPLSNSSSLQSIRKNPQIFLVCSLVAVSLAGCSLSNDNFTEELSYMCTLRSIRLSSNPFHCLVDFVKGLTRFNFRVLSSCARLQAVVGITSGDYSVVEYRPSLEKQILQSNLCHPQKCDVYILYDLESMKNIVKGPTEGMYETRGMFSFFFPGSKVPRWFSSKVVGSSLSFTMPLHLNPRLEALNVCCVYTTTRQIWAPHSLQFGIRNKTTGRTFRYCSNSSNLIEANEDMIWLSHLKFKSDELEPGDEVIVALLTCSMPFEVKEIGIHLVYKKQQQIGQQIIPVQGSANIGNRHFVLNLSVLLPLFICSIFGSTLLSKCWQT